MTTIDITTDIPTNINTLERLAVWALMALRRVNPTLAVNEVANEEPENVAQTGIFQASNNTIRFYGRISVELAEDYAEDNTVKLWMKANDISNVVLPAEYKTN